MQVTRWLIAILACSVLAATMAWFVAKQTIELPQTDTIQKPQEMTAAELLQQARHLWGSAPSASESGVVDQRVEQLCHMAAIRQAEHPQEIPAAWDQFGQLLADLRSHGERQGAENDGRLAQLNTELVLLMRYDDDLDDSALACRSAEEFDLVWHIKGRVSDAVKNRRAELVQQIQDRLAKGAQNPTDQDAVTEIKKFTSLKKDLDGPVVTLVATLGSAEVDNSLDQILGSAAVYEERAFQLVAALEKKTAEFEKQLRDLNNRIDPAPSSADGAAGSLENRGQSERILHKLRELDEAFAAADLASWQTIHGQLGRQTVEQTGRPPKATPAITRSESKSEVTSSGEGKFIDKIANLTNKLYSLQQLAYNMWALREIQSAEEDTDNWDVKLAPIDTGLLHPTVAALYSSTYGDQIKEVKDPPTLTAKAQHVLGNPKIELSAF